MYLKIQTRRIIEFMKGEMPRLIPLQKIRYEFGFGFGNLYHPYIEALKEGEPTRAAELLEHFYARMSDYLQKLPVSERLSVQAWRSDDAIIAKGMKRYIAAHQFEPRIDPREWRKMAEKKVNHLYELRESIESHGFDPERFGSVIRGPELNGQHVLLLGGQNRAAVLAELNWQRIPVAIKSRNENIPHRISFDRIGDLPLVRRGVISEETTGNILKRVSDGFTAEKARAHGFPFACTQRAVITGRCSQEI